MKNLTLINLFFNIISISISMLISLWIVPYMINTLGSAAYGYVPLTQQLVNYMSVITVAFTSLTGRFFLVSLKKNKPLEAEEYINTSFYSNIILSIVFLLPLTAVVYYLPNLIKIPNSLVSDVRISLLVYGIVFLITTVSSSLSVATFATNKLYLTSITQAIAVILRNIFIVMFFLILVPQLWYVSVAAFASSVLVFSLDYMIFKKLLPDTKLKISNFKFNKLKEMLSSSVWMSIVSVGSLLFLQVDLLIANLNLGPVIAGEYAAVLTWGILLRTFSSKITSVFNPGIVSLYAQDKIEDLVDYSNNSVKYSGLILALPIGIISGLGGVILEVWINESFGKYHLLLFIMTFHLSVNLSIQSLFSLQQAVMRIKIPAMVSLGFGTFNFFLAFYMSLDSSLGVYGIALAGALVLTMKNLIFTPIYSAYITNQPIFSYFKGIITPIILTSLVSLISFVFSKLISINSWSGIFIISLGITIVYFAVVYLFFTNKKEKKIMRSIFKKVF